MNTETVRKELPEGWENPWPGCFHRKDGALVTHYLGDYWAAYMPGHKPPAGDGLLKSPEEAIAALDREYPMEKQHGEK